MIRRAPGASSTHVYDIAGRKPTPIGANLNIGSKSVAAQKRARRKLEFQNTETHLIQDFAFPTVSHRIKVSRDGRYVFACGTYPPQIHIYDTDELSLKFKRHVTNDIVDFQILDDDWRKFVLLGADRYIDLHSQFGSHFRTRVPRQGRDLMLHRSTCDLYVCGEGADVWRLNLEQGRFMVPLSTVSGANGGNNVCGINPVNSLLAFGGETALLDIWDPRAAGRTKRPAGTLDVANALAEYRGSRTTRSMEICTLRFDGSDGVTLAVGTSLGHSLLFDLRSQRPIHARNQGNGLPVRSIRMHEDGKHCISVDPKSIKIWERSSGINVVAIEPDADINHLCLLGGSGVMCAAVETQLVKTYYVPELGPAPKWCAFLDNFTEELEMDKNPSANSKGYGANCGEEVYENFKFVPHDELEGLGLAHLIGTDLLKAYMHGYFVHQKLYRRAADVSEPFAYEKYRKEKARQKLEAERQSRITKIAMKDTKKVKVNQKVLETLQQKQKRRSKDTAGATSIADDERFRAMFTNRDYSVNEEAERYQYLHPSGTAQRRQWYYDNDSDDEYLERFSLVDGRANGNSGTLNNDNSRLLLTSDEEDVDNHNTKEARKNGSDQLQAEELTETTVLPAKRMRPRVPQMYEMEQLGAAVEVREHVKHKKGGGDARRKIRNEISLHTRISATQKYETRPLESKAVKDRRRRSPAFHQ